MTSLYDTLNYHCYLRKDLEITGVLMSQNHVLKFSYLFLRLIINLSSIQKQDKAYKNQATCVITKNA